MSEPTEAERTKQWTAKDADHIPRGRRVVLLCDPFAVWPSSKAFAESGIILPRRPPRSGHVVTRYRRSGEYMVRLEDGAWSFRLPRHLLLYPVPENVLPFTPKKRARR